MHKKILIQTMLIDIYIIQGIFQSPIIFQMSKLVCITENVQIAIINSGSVVGSVIVFMTRKSTKR